MLERYGLLRHLYSDRIKCHPYISCPEVHKLHHELDLHLIVTLCGKMPCRGLHTLISEISEHAHIYLLVKRQASVLYNPIVFREHQRLDRILLDHLCALASGSIKHEVSKDMIHRHRIMSFILLVCQMEYLMDVKIQVRRNNAIGKDRIDQLQGNSDLGSLIKDNILHRTDTLRQWKREGHMAIFRSELIINVQSRNKRTA